MSKEQKEGRQVEEGEALEFDRVASIIESILFSTDRPQSFSLISQVFRGTNIKTSDIRKAIEMLQVDYANGLRGVTLEEVSGGFQLRTKVDNMVYLKSMLKMKAFKLSGPALEVLSIVAYKQPCVKITVDEIRGVESGHLIRGLMDRGLVRFAGKSELPGKPMLYATTQKFLEIFGLRNLKELPSLAEMDELLPEGIGEVDGQEDQTQSLTDVAKELVQTSVEKEYSQSERELVQITEQLNTIETTSEFFEEEKRRLKAERNVEKLWITQDKKIKQDKI